MKKRLLSLVLSFTLLIATFIPVNAATEKDFTIKVNTVTATAGQNRVAVDILVENNPGVAGFSFCVNYDTEKLVLVESKIGIEDGYKVIAQPTGYGVNLAWTGFSGYSEDGKIATLYFNIPKDLATSEANIDIVYRAGYDSFYDSGENDIVVQTVNGKISIEALEETDTPSVNIGGVSANFDATDIVVPVTVKNNRGFSGFSFCINYDESRLILNSADILMDGGYKVVGHPEGYGVNIAWTSTEAYTENGTIAELHFSLKEKANSGKAYIDTIFREGYDSFYKFENGSEQDITFEAYSGYVDINNHNFGEWVVTTPATCTSTGLKTRTCLDCSKTETAVILKNSHEYVSVVTAPTCTSKGYTTHTCENCSDYYIDTYVDMVSHTLGEWEQSVAPECDVKGEEIQKCTICKNTINTREVDATGHTFGDWYTVIEATFDEDGQERRDCENCSQYETNTLPKLSESHNCDYTGTEEIITDASCTETGSKKIYCSETECGNYIVESIPAYGHDFSGWTITQKPTENAVGEIYRNCSVCGFEETDSISITDIYPKIIVKGSAGSAGDLITVSIALENNPGISSMKLKLGYDSENFDLKSITDTNKLGNDAHGTEFTTPYSLCWDNEDSDSDYEYNGSIVNLTFKIKEDAQIGTYPITLSYSSQDVVNSNFDKVSLIIENDLISIEESKSVPIDDLLYEITDDSITIIGYKGTKTDLVIEPTYTVAGVKYPVKTIAESAFETNKNIKSIVLPQTVTYIGDYAFYDCNSLEKVTILSSDITIGELALGYYYVSRKENGVVEGFTIVGHSGSMSEEYSAQDEKISFVALPIKGDFNNDGEVDVLDLVRLKKILVGIAISEGACPDIDASGDINSLDLMIFRKFLLGDIDSL